VMTHHSYVLTHAMREDRAERMDAPPPSLQVTYCIQTQGRSWAKTRGVSQEATERTV